MTRPLGYSVERRDMFADTPIAIRRPRPPGRGRIELLSEADARALRDALTAALGEDSIVERVGAVLSDAGVLASEGADGLGSAPSTLADDVPSNIADGDR